MNRTAILNSLDEVMAENQKAIDALGTFLTNSSKALRAVVSAISADPEPDEYLNIDQVAQRIHRAKGTVYQMTSKHQIPFYRRGKILLFKASEIDEWIKKTRVLTNDELLGR